MMIKSLLSDSVYACASFFNKSRQSSCLRITTKSGFDRLPLSCRRNTISTFTTEQWDNLHYLLINNQQTYFKVTQDDCPLMTTTLQQLMALLLRQAEPRHSNLCTSVTWICALNALLLCNSISTAGELEELSVTESDGEYRLQIVSILDAPVDYVYNVITDYLHGYRINPTITEVEIIPSGRNEVVRVRNLSEQCVGPICFNIDWVGDIVEPSYGNINVETIPELSNFESGSAVWEIRPQGERTWVLHKSSLKPGFFMPPVIVNKLMNYKMRKDTLATFNRIECHAKIAHEIEMENEPELIEALIDEGRNCIKL